MFSLVIVVALLSSVSSRTVVHHTYQRREERIIIKYEQYGYAFTTAHYSGKRGQHATLYFQTTATDDSAVIGDGKQISLEQFMDCRLDTLEECIRYYERERQEGQMAASMVIGFMVTILLLFLIPACSGSA